MKSKPTYQELEKENEILRQKLKISKGDEKFKCFFENNKAIMLQIHAKTKQVIKANKAAVNFYGYSKNELLQKTISDLNTLSLNKINTTIKEVVKNKSNFFQFQHKLSNGKIKDVEIYVLPFSIDDEIQMIAIVYDITERKKAEQNLKLFKKIANSTLDHMSFIDTDYVYQAVNNAYLNAHKKTENKIIGYSIAELFGDDIFNNTLKEKTDACFTGKTIKFQEWFDFKGIGKRYMNVSYYPYLENNKIAGLIVVSSDITEWKKAEQAVKKENERFKNIMDINPAGIYLVDKQYNIEYINPIIEKEFGQVNGKKCYSYFHGLSEVCKWCKNKEVFAGKSVRWEWFSEKNKKHYDLFDIPIKNPDGTISKFEIFFDVTDRKKAEKALILNQNRLKEAQKTAHLGHWELDIINNKLTWSDEIYRIFDLKPQEFDATYEAFLKKIHPDDRNKVDEAYTNSLKTQMPYEIEHRLLLKSGKIKYVLEKCKTKYDKSGNPLHSFGTVSDITIQKENEKAIKDSEVKYRNLSNFLPIIIYEVDITGKFIFANKQAFKSFGYTDEIYDDKFNVLNMIIAEDRARAKEVMQNIFHKKNNQPIEYTGLRKDGSTFPILVYSNAILKNNKPIGIRGAIIDLTDRKKAEQALKDSNNTKDKFFSIIAHDLKSPFNAILGFSNILVENHKNYDIEKRDMMINAVDKSANSAFKLLENLLTWSHSQSGKITFTPEKLHLKILLTETMYELQASANQKEIQLTETISNNEMIFADKSMITTILRNLISNAIKFTNKNGNIIISSNKQENSNFIEISVKDTGVGISKDRIDDLFRIDKDTSTQGTENETGTGLGLILCKEFVEKHGGKIWVESEIEKGSKFIFSIPKKL